MKKFKYLLIVSIIAIMVGGMLVGCELTGRVDVETHPILVTYCANGGSLDGRAERYIFLEEGVTVPEPGKSTAIAAPTRVGYRFEGWKVGKLDETKLLQDPSGDDRLGEHYVPLLKSESEVELVSEKNSSGVTVDRLEYNLDSKYGAQDGGVFMTVDGAVPEDEAIATIKNVNISEDRRNSIRAYLYDYDREAENYDFNSRNWWEGREADSNGNVNKDIVLIAVWSNYNQYIVADKKADGTWEDTDDYEALIKDMEENPRWLEGDAYAKLQDRLFDVTANNGTRILGRTAMLEAYEATRNAAYYKAQKKLEECKEILKSNELTDKERREAEANRDKAQEEFDKQQRNYTAIRFFTDTSLERGGASDLTGKEYLDVGLNKLTVLYYTEEVGDVDVAFNFSDFNTAITTGRDIYIDDDLSSMGGNVSLNSLRYSGTIKGNDHTITANASLVQLSREGLTSNNYSAFLGRLVNANISNLNITLNFTFTISVNPYEYDNYGELKYKENEPGVLAKDSENDKNCYVGLLAETIENSTISNVNIDATYKIIRDKNMGILFPNQDTGKQDSILLSNNYAVDVHIDEENVNGLQAKGADSDGGNTVTGCTITTHEQCEATYYLGGTDIKITTPATQTVAKGETIQLPDLPDIDEENPGLKRENYRFDGWYVFGSEEVVYEAGEEIALDKTTNFIAKWTKTKCVVSFSLGRGVTGDAPDSIVVDMHGNVILPECTVEREGYTFVCWQIPNTEVGHEDEYVDYRVGDSFSPDRDYVFTAKWEENS